MCKHDKNFTIIETGETALFFDVENYNDVSGTQVPGNIRPVVEFRCRDCGYSKKFNRITTKVKYLKNAYETAVYNKSLKQTETTDAAKK